MMHLAFLLASLGYTWVLAHDVVNNPEAADLVAPWLVAYPLALLVCALNVYHVDTTQSISHLEIGEFCVVLL